MLVESIKIESRKVSNIEGNVTDFFDNKSELDECLDFFADGDLVWIENENQMYRVFHRIVQTPHVGT